MDEPTTYVIAFNDGTIYTVDDVVDATIDDVEAPAPRLTLTLTGATGVRLNFASVKFLCSWADYLARVAQR